MIELYVVLVLIIAAAIVAIETKDLLSAVIALGAVGFGVTLAFLYLQAPDLAIVQIVVEILTLVFMIAVILKTTRVDNTSYSSADVFPSIATGLFIAVILAVCIYSLADLPPFGEPLLRVASRYIASGLEEVGGANLVADVILDYRAYDTLGEATVLFTSVIGVLVVLRKLGRIK